MVLALVFGVGVVLGVCVGWWHGGYSRKIGRRRRRREVNNIYIYNNRQKAKSSSSVCGKGGNIQDLIHKYTCTNIIY